METKTELEKDISFSRAKIFFYIFAGILFIFAVYYFSEIKSDVALFVNVKPLWLIVAILAQGGTYLAGAAIYHNLIEAFDDAPLIPILKLFQANIVTLFIDQTIPSADISGIMFFFNFIKKKGIDEPDAFSLILVELLTFYVTILSIIFALILICLFIKGIPAYFIVILMLGLVIFGVLGTVAWLLGQGQTIFFLVKKLSKISFLKHIFEKYKLSPFKKLKSPGSIFKKHTYALIGAALLQVCILLFDSLTILALFYGLGLPVALSSIFLVFILSKIISSLPISPGSLVVYEAGMTLFFVTLGVPVATAAIVTILYRVLSFWLPMPIGFLLYRKLLDF